MHGSVTGKPLRTQPPRAGVGRSGCSIGRPAAAASSKFPFVPLLLSGSRRGGIRWRPERGPRTRSASPRGGRWKAAGTEEVSPGLRVARAGRWVGWGGDGVASRDAGPDPRARPARVVSCRVTSRRGGWGPGSHRRRSHARRGARSRREVRCVQQMGRQRLSPATLAIGTDAGEAGRARQMRAGLDRKRDVSSFWYPLRWIGLA